MSEELPVKKEPPSDFDLAGLGAGYDAPELPPELEKSLGIAIEKMTDPTHALTLGELNLLERKCLTAVYMKYLIYKLPIYRSYISDYVTRTSAYKRQRADELVKILQGIQQFKRVTFGQRVRDAVNRL